MGRRLIFVLTSPLALERMLGGQLKFLARSGFDVSVVCGPGEFADRFAETEAVPVVTLPLRREISLADDCRALCALYRLFRNERPDIVHVGTPKAGLLGGLAAWLARVPVRVYTIHGLRLDTASGLKRMALWTAEWLTCWLAQAVVCVSSSVRQRAIELSLLDRKKARVLGQGSANGAPLSLLEMPIRRFGDIGTIGFVGRLTADKGIADLVVVFEELQRLHPNLRLLIVGDFEDGDPVAPDVRDRIARNSAINCTGFDPAPWRHYRDMDLLLLPSYREGLPNVVLEAGVYSLPVVAYAATGSIDAVVDGKTGLLARVGDTAGMTSQVCRLIGDPSLTRQLGENSRERVVKHFAPELLWGRVIELYNNGAVCASKEKALPPSAKDRLRLSRPA